MPRGYTDSYLASKDDDELLDMLNNWPLDVVELEQVEAEIEHRLGYVPRIAADEDI